MKTQLATKRFTASKVKVYEFNATVTIQPHNQDYITVDVSANHDDPASLVEIEVINNTLHIAGTEKAKNEITFSKGGAGIVISNNVIQGDLNISGITINGIQFNDVTSGLVKPKQPLNIEITLFVPRGTQLDLSSIGKTTVGDIEGNIDLVAKASSVVTIGRMLAIKAYASSGGKITCEEISGNDVNLRCSSGGEISLLAGNGEHLVAKASAGGKIVSKAIFQSAEIGASSGGSIFVAAVSGHYKSEATSGGTVTLGRRSNFD